MAMNHKKNLEQILPEGQLVNRAWLKKHGFQRPWVDYAVRAGRLTAACHGIYRRPGPPLKWEHVVFSLNEMGYSVHVGGRSALELQGLAHYLHLGETQRIDLYSSGKIPVWTQKIQGTFHFEHHTRRLFEVMPKAAISTRLFGSWDWPIPYSTPELALFELLTDVREESDFAAADKFFESAVNLRPELVHELLLNCRLVKTKRLFLWFAEHHGHAWCHELEREDIDLGHGKRVLIKGGSLDAVYQITVPKEMIKNNDPGIY